MKIRDLEVPVPLFLAPMAGVTDPPFRAICHSLGAPVTCSEMVSSAGLAQGGRRTLSYIDMAMDPGPSVIQIFGTDPAKMRLAAALCVVRQGVAMIDINMGCPVRKVMRNGAGAAMMAKPDLASTIVRAVKDIVPIPVTVKIRTGLTASSIVAPEFARRMEDAGADAVAVHGRTAAQGYAGRADWSVIAAVKKAVSIPVIGNGDVKSYADARRMIDETGCDGVMVGRAALGNPWLFASIAAGMRGEPVVERTPTLAERIEVSMRHLDYMSAYMKSEERAFRVMRKHFIYYTRGLRNSVAIRPEIMKTTRREEILALLAQLEEPPAGAAEIGPIEA